MAHALDQFGVNVWRYAKEGELERAIESKIKENKMNERIALFIGSLEWKASELDGIARRFREEVAPFIEAAKKAGKEVGCEG